MTAPADPPAVPPAPIGAELAREYRAAILAGDTNAAFVYLRRRVDETGWTTSTAGKAVELLLNQPAGAVPDTGQPAAPAGPMTPPPPPRGSGSISCCGNHRERCIFGHSHHWHFPWMVDAKVQRTSETMICARCNSVCTAEEEFAAEPVEQGGVPDTGQDRAAPRYCVTCDHEVSSWHDEDGFCLIEGCSCDAVQVPPAASSPSGDTEPRPALVFEGDQFEGGQAVVCGEKVGTDRICAWGLSEDGVCPTHGQRDVPGPSGDTAPAATEHAFLRWLVSMDDPEDVIGREERRTVTLDQIIGRARALLGVPSSTPEGSETRG